MREVREGDRKVATDADGCVHMRAMREAQMRHVRTEAKRRPSVCGRRVCVRRPRRPCVAGRAATKGEWDRQLSGLDSMDLTTRQYNDTVSPFATPLTLPAPGSRGSQTTLRDLAGTDNRRVDRNVAPQLSQPVAMRARESVRSAGSTLGDLPPDDFLDQRAPVLEYTWPHRTIYAIVRFALWRGAAVLRATFI
jgi:hypothetical protein